MTRKLEKNEAVTYGDFRITTECDQNGKHTLKVSTDDGFIKIQPSSGNTIIVESTKK